MSLKTRIALLLALMGAALFTGAEALRSLRPVPGADFPEEIYSTFARSADSAAYYLRQSGAYVAVYPGKRGREPLRVTEIEMQSLRRADRAMIQRGLPVRGLPELLELLEDLSS